MLPIGLMYADGPSARLGSRRRRAALGDPWSGKRPPCRTGAISRKRTCPRVDRAVPIYLRLHHDQCCDTLNGWCHQRSVRGRASPTRLYNLQAPARRPPPTHREMSWTNVVPSLSEARLSQFKTYLAATGCPLTGTHKPQAKYWGTDAHLPGHLQRSDHPYDPT
jgi:hypothetical protein